MTPVEREACKRAAEKHLRLRRALEIPRLQRQVPQADQLVMGVKYQVPVEREEAAECCRREKVEVRSAAKSVGPRAIPPAIRILKKQGRRVAHETPLTKDDLYLDDLRPLMVTYPKILHTCSLCLGLKSHPVVYICGHSHCFVCTRISLETSWACKSCGKTITRRPVPHEEEEASIARDFFAGWDESRVTYNWKGLSFPRPTYHDDSE
ncbi:hypothetical protein B0H19DRAFT_1262410 [Mycena capillaripes]|nr:hypothetical protein B0H19DRAFT_1262410 [Mycena capillaripes]